MNPFQIAFDRIGQVEDELDVVQRTLHRRWREATCIGDEHHRVAVALSNSERTYLVRLLTEFEGTLSSLGPHLATPMVFTAAHSLGDMLNGIGKNLGIDKGLRVKMDSDIRDLRNELTHGGLIPRVAFSDALSLVRAFLRWCR